MSSIVPNIEKRAKMLNILENKSIYLSTLVPLAQVLNLRKIQVVVAEIFHF